MLNNLIYCNLDIYVKQIFLNVVFVVWPCEKGPNLYFVHTLFYSKVGVSCATILCCNYEIGMALVVTCFFL